MRYALLVAVGGAAGSLLRWALAGAVQRWTASTLPWGTFTVNAIGSLLIGIVAAISLERALVSPETRTFLVFGLLGGFTTFSALSYETFALLRDGQWTVALAYSLGSVLVGVSAAIAGFAVGMKL